MIIDWERHRQRLLRGLELLNARPDEPFQALFSALEVKGAAPSGFLSRHVEPAVRAALEAFYGAPPGGPGGREEAAAAEEVRAAAAERGAAELAFHSMLLVCIAPLSAPPPPPPPPPPPERMPDAASGRSAAGRDPGLIASAAAAAAAAAATPPEQGRHTHAADDGDGGGGGDGTGGSGTGGGGGGRGVAAELPVAIGVYVKPVQPPPYGVDHAVQAAVMGRPRSLAGAKACSWVAERRGYEERKPAEAAEVLLSDAEGRILEGLTTNFAVVTVDGQSGSGGADAGGGGGAAAAAAAALAAGAVTLHTCGPAGGAALPGVVQGRVLEAAAALGMRVELEPPAAADRGAWREAFISNCIRRVQPLRRVFCPPGNAWGADPWDCALPSPAGLHTTALLREVQRLEARTPWRQLCDGGGGGGGAGRGGGGHDSL